MTTISFQRFTKSRNTIQATTGNKVIATITRQFDYDDPGAVLYFKVEWTEPNKHPRYNFKSYCHGAKAGKVLSTIKKDIQARYNK